jgi:FkbM family methyltransferase
LKNIGKEGKVYAWEPNQFLYENYLSKWPFKNLTGYNYALSDKTGEQDYYIYGEKGTNSGINSLEREDLRKHLPHEIKQIKTKTLDDWWEQEGKPKVDLIKIDCEGHDYKILRGGEVMIGKVRPEYIVIEQQDKDVTNFLKNFDYTDQHEHGDLGLYDSIWKYNVSY